MKIFKLLSILLCLCLQLQAQQEVNNQWKNQINPVFQGLDKSKIPHDLLLDYAMEFTNVPAYNGTLTDSTYVDANILGNIYKTLFMAKVTTATANFPKLETIAENWVAQRQNYNQTDKSTIVLAGLYYNYANLNPAALKTNKITIFANRYYDKYVNSIWQNPYETKQTIAFASPIKKYNKRSFGVVLPQNLLLSNNSNAIQNIAVNFNDDTGYKILTTDQKTTVNYTENGVYNWLFKTTLVDGTVLYAQTKIQIDAPEIATNNLPTQSTQSAFENNIVISGPNSSSPLWANGAVLRIDYAPSHGGQLKKPFIVAEGFDTGSILTPEIEGGNRTLQNFKNDIDLYTESGNLSSLLYNNSTQEYDIVYIDWQNGTNSIQHNSEVLKNVLAWVNAKKLETGSTEPNVLLGQSMGGIIGRYTLANMEAAGETHDVRLFVAHDSPMQGANTPLSLQYFSRHAYDQYTSAPILYGLVEVVIPTVLNFVELMSLGNLDIAFPSVEDVLTLQDTPAAMQMNYHYVDYSSEPTTAVHDTWQQEFDSAGYPTQSRNIAISNGNECAVDHGFDPRDKFISLHDTHNPDVWGDLVHLIATPLAGIVTNDLELTFLGLLPGSSKYFFDFDLHANPGVYDNNRKVYRGKIRYEKKLLWAIPISHTITDRNKYAPSGYLPFDTYSGGYYDFVENIAFDFQDYIPSGSVVNSRYGFIPVVSALDIKRDNANVNPSDYLKSYSGGTIPEPTLTTKFDNFIVDFIPNTPTNNAHISFQVRNGNWLANELDVAVSLIDDCSFICNSDAITGTSRLCDNVANFSVPLGADSYQWTITNTGVVTVLNNTTSNILSIIRNGELSGWVTLNVAITSVKCGNVTLEKNVYVGVPKVESIEEVTVMQTGHDMPFSDGSNSCDDIGLKLNIAPSNNEIEEFEWEKVTTNYQWSLDLESTLDEYVIISPYCNGGISFKVRIKNACGWSDWETINYNITTCTSDCMSETEPDGISSTNFDIYPVPANTTLYVKLKNVSTGLLFAGDSLTIKIYNQFGLLVKNVNAISTPTSIDVSDLPTGIYTIVIDYNGVIESHQIVIN